MPRCARSMPHTKGSTTEFGSGRCGYSAQVRRARHQLPLSPRTASPLGGEAFSRIVRLLAPRKKPTRYNERALDADRRGCSRIKSELVFIRVHPRKSASKNALRACKRVPHALPFEALARVFPFLVSVRGDQVDPAPLRGGASILHRFGKVFARDPFGAGKIRDGAGNAQHAVVGTG